MGDGSSQDVKSDSVLSGVSQPGGDGGAMELHGGPQTFPEACTLQSTDAGARGVLLPGEEFV